jgi:hypothetical protein
LTALLSLRCRLHQLQEQVESAEQSIKTRLESGAALELGDHHAELKENFRRNVAWKAVVIRLAERLRMDGEAYCARVLSSTNLVNAPWSRPKPYDDREARSAGVEHEQEIESACTFWQP